jgi:hypothetical protein
VTQMDVSTCKQRRGLGRGCSCGWWQVGVVLLFCLWGCDDGEPVAPPAKSGEMWIRQDVMESKFFTHMIHSGDALYVAAGREGVFMQSPAFFGEWAAPDGGVLGCWVVDWDRRYVPVVEKVGGVGQLYCFNLGLALGES